MYPDHSVSPDEQIKGVIKEGILSFEIAQDIPASLIHPQKAPSERKVLVLQEQQDIMNKCCIALWRPAHSISDAHDSRG